ncbi:hypothetical protein Sjap_003318 [Stephania japonica]|uniref:Uncharacterized protein n=1 Tax=Stephania japonica TaxID=461633 RepID=A0AAP0KQ43_9MAGN
MAEDSKWVSDSGLAELGDFMGEKAEMCDQNQRYCLIENRGSDSFIVDIETLSHNHGLDEELITTPTNSNTTKVNMMRNFSKKESRQGESKSTSGAVASCDATNGPSKEELQTYSPRKPTCTGEEGIKTQVKLVQKQMERMTNIDNNQGKYYTWPRRYCKQRFSARLMDPRRVLFFFATLSSLGTIILIYFSLSVAKLGDNTS